MPELDFKGKEFVRNHHLTVPYRLLLPDKKKSIGDGGLDGNLIIHGDNLHALKALLPRYAGKVDCIFIDPPYNTGNEGWSYNDNVNSPVMKAWFTENPVTIEDGLRHDKWCCMMWPRLKLLWELLSECGSFWMTLDENEAHRGVDLLNEVFGEENRVAVVTWWNKVSPSNDAKWFSDDHDSVIVYAKDKASWRPERLERHAEQLQYYSNPDKDSRGDWNSSTYTCNKTAEQRPNLYYEIVNPNTGKGVWPDRAAVWAYDKVANERHVAENRIYWGVDGTAMPRLKVFLSEVRNVVPRTIWKYDQVGSTQEGTQEVNAILPGNSFTSPKPTRLIDRVLHIALGTQAGGIVLDSFAGSGTTGHAVLKRNIDCQFILVETEEYADSLTAERVRRVINGYPFEGTQRETLLERNLTWTELKKAEALVKEVEAIQKDRAKDFDKVKAEVKDGKLKVVGKRKVKERAPGLGGTFTYCTLGEPVDTDRILAGDGMPTRQQMSEWLLYTAFGKTVVDKPALDFDKGTPRPSGGEGKGVRGQETRLADLYVGKMGGTHVWLIYEPDKDFLQGPNAALTRELAQRIDDTDRHSNHLVFSAAKYVGHKALREDTKGRVEHALIPFSLFSLERD